MNVRLSSTVALASLLAACGSEPSSSSSDCDQACRDRTALRGLRETLKLVYNLTLQGKPVGPQDQSMQCPQGGSARIFGEATSEARQGATLVDLSYVLADCRYLQRDDDRDENYDLVLTGMLTQRGTLAVQPSATTALLIAGEGVSLRGTVFDPALPYEEDSCDVELGQNGNLLSGYFCGRSVGIDL